VTVGSSLSIWNWIILIVIACLAIAFLRRPRRKARFDIEPGRDKFAEWKALKAKKAGEGLTAEEEDRLKTLDGMFGARQARHRQPGDDKGDPGFAPTRPRKKD
jgi:hypothetical protein